MSQADIDKSCLNFSGQSYKVNWTRFNTDSTVKEVVNLQNGTCMKLPAQPPTSVPTQVTPNPFTPPDNIEKNTTIETTLAVTSSSTRARFKNCVNAKVNNLPTEPVQELGCNRDSPFGNPRFKSTVKIKVQTNVCNVLVLSLTSQSSPGGSVNTLATSSTSSRFIIRRTGLNSFNIMANDNNDNDWNDLNLTVTGDGSFKFTMDGQPCPK